MAFSTVIEIAAPIVVPLEKAPAAASVCTSRSAFDSTVISPLETRFDPLRAEASVS